MQQPLAYVGNYKLREDWILEDILQTDSFGPVVFFSFRWTWNILHICMHLTTIYRLLRKNSQSRKNGCRNTPILSIFQFHQWPSLLKRYLISSFIYATLESSNFIRSKASRSKNCIVFCRSIRVAGLGTKYPIIPKCGKMRQQISKRFFQAPF